MQINFFPHIKIKQDLVYISLRYGTTDAEVKTPLQITASTEPASRPRGVQTKLLHPFHSFLVSSFYLPALSPIFHSKNSLRDTFVFSSLLAVDFCMLPITHRIQYKISTICFNSVLVFLTETWLRIRPTGDECEMAAVTPPGFTLKSVPRANGTGGGLSVLFGSSLVDCVKVSTKDFEVCETRLCYQDQSVTFLCVYRPPPSRKNKPSNKMFLDEFPDLLEPYVSCDRPFVLGDINFHFDSDSDVSVADLKKTKNKTAAQSQLTATCQCPQHLTQ